MNIGPLPLDKIASLSGLEVLRGMIAGTLPMPPFSQATRIFLAEAEQ